MGLRRRGYLVEGFKQDEDLGSLRASMKTVESFLDRKYRKLDWKVKGPYPARTTAGDVYVTVFSAEDKRYRRGAYHTLEFQAELGKNYVYVYYISPSPRQRSSFYQGKLSDFLSKMERHMSFLPV